MHRHMCSQAHHLSFKEEEEEEEEEEDEFLQLKLLTKRSRHWSPIESHHASPILATRLEEEEEDEEDLFTTN